MKNAIWLFNRLKAMNFGEVLWRIQQKFLQRKEFKRFYLLNKPVTHITPPEKISNLSIDIEKLSINWDNENLSIFEKLDLLGDFEYEEYKKEWNAGFQTINTWDQHSYSHTIPIVQRTDVGDIRTNWELNRHYQFVGLAKNFYITGENRYLLEFSDLFNHWNENNLFLHGVQWTSAMEVAIRVNSWVFTYAFLAKGFKKYGKTNTALLSQLEQGVILMADYIVNHRARFSSANNHLIIEMYAVALVGVLCDYKPWKRLAIDTLTSELSKQNYPDGVNKEMSLHYQSFVMEAYGILLILLQSNKEKMPEIWYQYLEKMSEFVSDCCGHYGETIIFGDNDGGKILNLSGLKFDHYRYILDLMSLVLERKYSELDNPNENVSWLSNYDFIKQAKRKEKYIPLLSKCYKQGGYTILRSRDKRVLIGMDHADLGFGPIAAHGHADGLSMQIFIEGTPVLVDPGTFNYHVTPQDRDYYRKTENHNTVTVGGINQSVIHGPFLWGKKAKCTLLEYLSDSRQIEISAKIEYEGIQHTRKVVYDFDRHITVHDYVLTPEHNSISQTWNFGPTINIKIQHNKIITSHVVMHSTGKVKNEGYCQYSPDYNYKTASEKCSFTSLDNEVTTHIQIM